MTLYRVKEGCEIDHANQTYFAGDEIELPPDLALFHAANLEAIEEVPAPTRRRRAEVDAREPGSISE